HAKYLSCEDKLMKRGCQDDAWTLREIGRCPETRKDWPAAASLFVTHRGVMCHIKMENNDMPFTDKSGCDA
ncbi:MAG: hypothetical protein ACRCUT_12560, partial [Spirochaetota bacterium]